MEDRLQYAELQRDEYANNLEQLKAQHESELSVLRDDCEEKQRELNETRDIFEKKIDEMVNEFDDIARRLKAKIDR